MSTTDKLEKEFRAWKRQQSKQGVFPNLYPGNQSSNWDGSWWIAMWSDGYPTSHIEITANKRFDGLAYCRSQATKEAWNIRWEGK